MKKKLVNLFSLMFAILLIIFSFAGCGANSKYNKTDEIVEYDSEETVEDVDLKGNTDKTILDNRKIIENINLSIQTKEYDKLIEKINNQIKDLGGYIQSSNSYGREYDSDATRTAEYTIRIPANKSGEFTDYISKNSVVVNKSVTTEDVTLKYVDMESRVGVLEAEKTALENLLKSATKTSDIIDIRDKLTDVIGDIESYKSQLRTYDNLVSYSTITITVNEVERTAVVEKQGVWQRIGTNLKNNFLDVWNFLVNFFVFMISAIPYLIIIAVITVVVVLIVKKSKKNRTKF